MKWYSPLFLFLILMPAVFAQERLIFAVDVIRHGDRAPLSDLPKTPHVWPYAHSQLMPLGMRKSFDLGVKLRKVYISQNHLLPSHYTEGTMLVLSTAYNRTIMTAQSLLYGLYPLGTGPHLGNASQPALPDAFQPVPVYTAPKDLLVPITENKVLNKLVMRYVAPGLPWKKMMARTTRERIRWGKVVGVKITDLNQLIFIGDTLFIYQRYHLPLPKDLNAKDIREIQRLGHWAFLMGYKNKIICQATAGKLLSAITTQLQLARLHATKLKYILFSAHDYTIMGLMCLLNQRLDEVPAYGSNLNFSLYQDRNRFRLKITYNEKVIEEQATLTPRQSISTILP